MSSIAPPPNRPIKRRPSGASRLESPGGLLGVGIVSIGAALALTFALRHVVGRAVFVFFWGAVGGLAALGGFWAGFTVAVISLALADYFFIAPAGFGIADRSDIASSIAFVAVATLVSWFAEMQRRARQFANEQLQVAQDQAAELEVQQEETQVLAEELEQANAALEAAIETANAARTVAETSEGNMRLLDDAGRILANSLDYEGTVSAVARLAVPKFADWCAVDLLVDGKITQLALAHVEPEKVVWAQELNTRYPPDPAALNGVPQVIRSGEPQLLPTITDEMIEAGARDPEHLAILKGLRLRSAIIVPMQARGTTLGALTLIRTSAQRKYDEQDLAVARELARRAGLAIDNARLYRAALTANEAKANFLATMSHELRTPLTAIIGYEELLAEGITAPITDGQRTQLARIKSSALHLLGLIEEILTYARIEAGQETVRLEAAAVKAVVDDAVAFVEPMAMTKGLVLDVMPPDPKLMMLTDAGKLRQVLTNLLSNAVKFTSEGGTISLRCTVGDDSVTIAVSDTGIGIPPEHHERIFDPFWQVQQHSTRTAGGSGLGLSVTRRLAEALGGEVTVESTPGVGSTFKVRLRR